MISLQNLYIHRVAALRNPPVNNGGEAGVRVWSQYAPVWPPLRERCRADNPGACVLSILSGKFCG